MRDKYDIVVIGSGIGGLVSAALLSNLGKKILVIEKEPKPGGYLNEFKRDGFTFDVSLHLLNGCNKGGYTAELFRKCGIIDDIKFLKPKYLYRSVFPDFDMRVPQTDTKAYKDMLITRFPKSRKSIEALFNEMANVFRAVNDRLSSGRFTSALLPYAAGTCESVISRHIKDEKLKAIIYQLWSYVGLPPSRSRAVDFCYPWFDYVNNGGYYLEKGSYEIIRQLVRRIKAAGGDFLFNKSVDGIATDNGSCRKVIFGKDEVICDTIISNIDLNKTIHNLIGCEKFPSQSVKKIGDIEPSISAFEIFLGLDADMKNLYPDDYEIFVNADYDTDKQYKDCVSNAAKAAPFVITINSNVNEFSASNGKSVVSVIMLAGYKCWDLKSKEEYQDKKEKTTDILLARASRIIPEIKTRLRKKVVATPITFERYTNNVRGAIYGYARTIGRKKEVRPNDMKGIKNLYFASAWARPGSGVVKVLRSAEDICGKISKCAYESAAV
ncbi:MAG: NAD(P)/FAD-dependent oxidoreductase [Candidatus Omnitrophota bacterium]|nr:NAD(P)/FAD-dependent oxidoreductase [Candidatus Omnitrophota bacterium]